MNSPLSSEEILSLYANGELVAAIGQYHHEDGEQALFTERCVSLHNNGSIDLTSVVAQPEFAQLETQPFFIAQSFFCDAIPQLSAQSTAMMQCCRTLIDKSGADGSTSLVIAAFGKWCEANPKQSLGIVDLAREGDALAIGFVTLALQGSNDLSVAIEFVRQFDGLRRVGAIRALPGLVHKSATAGETVLSTLEPLTDKITVDVVRASAVRAVLDLMRAGSFKETVERVIDNASDTPGPHTLHTLAEIFWLHQASLDRKIIQKLLFALEDVDPSHTSTIGTIDMGLYRLLESSHRADVVRYLTSVLSHGVLTLDAFASTKHALALDKNGLLFELLVTWLSSDSAALYANAVLLVRMTNDRAFSGSIEPHGLSPAEQLFFCHKVVGFLFLYSVTCCSLLVSALRAADPSIRCHVEKLLSEIMLVNYGGKPKDYLSSLGVDDPAYEVVQSVLETDREFHRAMDSVGVVKELHPSESQLNLVHQQSYDRMRTAQKEAEKSSVIDMLASRSVILHGNRMLTYVTDMGGTRKAIELTMQSHGVSWELPRLEVLDPIGLDIMLRSLRQERRP